MLKAKQNQKNCWHRNNLEHKKRLQKLVIQSQAAIQKVLNFINKTKTF